MSGLCCTPEPLVLCPCPRLGHSVLAALTLGVHSHPAQPCRARKAPQEPERGPLHPLQLAETALQPRESLLGNRNRNVMS